MRLRGTTGESERGEVSVRERAARFPLVRALTSIDFTPGRVCGIYGLDALRDERNQPMFTRKTAAYRYKYLPLAVNSI